MGSIASYIHFAVVQDDLHKEAKQDDTGQDDEQNIGSLIILLRICRNRRCYWRMFCGNGLSRLGSGHGVLSDRETWADMEVEGGGPGAANGLAGSRFPHTHMPVIGMSGFG